MSRGINRVTLIGHLGATPEMRSTSTGNHVTTLSLATHESWRDRATQATQERTEWHRVVLFSRLAELANQYLAKGSQVYIEGSLRTHKWKDQKGQDRYTTEVVANEMELLGTVNRKGSEPKEGQISNDLEEDDIPF